MAAALSLGAWHLEAVARLEAGGCPDPETDARALEESVLGLSPAELRRGSGVPLGREQREALEARLLRRLGGEPVQYITGRAWFYGLPFFVDERVLIPRFDTENLVEAALRFLQSARKAAPAALDLCAGSGAIGLTLARLLPACRVTLADVSARALAVARRNAEDLGVAARVDWAEGDLFVPLKGRTFDLVCCNPPYIPRGELPALQREVRREPALALDGGEDGLDFYRRIAAGVDGYLAPGGRIYLEVGIRQAGPVREMLRAALGATESGVVRDLNGIERVVWAGKGR